MCYSVHHLMVPGHFYYWVAGSFKATTCKTRPAGRVRPATLFCPAREMLLNYNGNRPAACHRPPLHYTIESLSCLPLHRPATLFCPAREMLLNYNGNRPAACHRPPLHYTIESLSCLPLHRLRTNVTTTFIFSTTLSWTHDGLCGYWLAMLIYLSTVHSICDQTWDGSGAIWWI